jgi:hypothetical protein
MRHALILILALVLGLTAPAQETHPLKVFFRYGSIPEIGYERIEYEETGGLHGGHVSLGLDSLEIGFTNNGRIHIFPRKGINNGIFYWTYLEDFENQIAGKKYITFVIPLNDSQYHRLRDTLMAYIANPPYDYAFFGMRCAAAAYDVLSQIGLFRPLSRTDNILSNFYPRLFRRKMFALARQKGYQIIRVRGRRTRIWEGD